MRTNCKIKVSKEISEVSILTMASLTNMVKTELRQTKEEEQIYKKKKKISNVVRMTELRI
jgi:hypothetical protein